MCSDQAQVASPSSHLPKTGETADRLSPSVVHQRLMRELKPALSYDGGDVKQWQNRLRRKLRSVVGYTNMPARKCALNPRTLWRREHELGSIEKLVFTSEEGSDVPAYLCLPRQGRPPYPVFICVQGHSTGMHHSIGVMQDDELTPMDEVPGDRDYALECMRRGMAALCIEQRAFGERLERRQERRHESRCIDASMHALMLGRTLVGERVYDVDRGIDLLMTRPEVDPKRIGLMGNSTGGTITMFGAALLQRVAFAMPSCYVCMWRDSVMNIRHCVDNYVPNILPYMECPDVAGLIAPRPLVVVTGVEDPIFPIAGVREAYEKIHRIYVAAGAADRCRLVLGPEGHRFYADLAWAQMQPMVMQS